MVRLVQIMPAPGWTVLELYWEDNQVKHAVAQVVGWGLSEGGGAVEALVMHGDRLVDRIEDDEWHLSIVMEPGEPIPDVAERVARFEKHRSWWQRTAWGSK